MQFSRLGEGEQKKIVSSSLPSILQMCFGDEASLSQALTGEGSARLEDDDDVFESNCQKGKEPFANEGREGNFPSNCKRS